ncbi:ANO7 [Symbiodinium microadriaticum]|nr:ANO7 [Symbiodinium microadriaticum]
MKSFIHGKDIVYFPATERYKKICLSSTIVFLFIVLVVGVVISIYVMRAALSNSLGSVAQLIASVVNAVQIQIFNYYYESLVDDLTEWENHRTDTEFEDSMITKLYLFQFVNSYASFFYVAFIASSIPSETSAHGDCGASTCMIPLGLNLAIIFGVQEAVTITTDGIIPYLLHRYRSFRLKEYAQEEFGQQDLPQISKEFLLDGYDILKGALGEYAEMAVQFGYILLFATALPIAPLMGLATCLLESKADTFKFLFLKRRPRMKGAEDIGMWQTIFTLTASAAIVTNAAIAVFTMDIFNDRQTDVRFWFFIIYQWIVFSFQAVLMALIPDEPYAIEIQRERRKILVDKVIFKIPDVDAAEVDYVKFDADAIRKFTVHEFAEQHEFKAEGQPVSENQRPRSLVRPTLDRVGAARDVRVDSGEKDMFQSMSGADPGGHMGKGDLVARDVKRASGQWQPPSSPTIDSPSPNTPRRGMHLYTDMSTKKLAKATADTVTPKSRVLPRQRSSITSPSSKDKSSVKNRTRKPSFFTFGQKSSKTIAKDDNL